MLQAEQYSIPYPFTLFDSLDDGIYIVDKAWCFTYVNKKGAEFVGKSPDDLLGKNIWEFFPEAKELIIYTEMHRAVEAKRSAHFEFYYALRETWFECHLYPSEEGLVVLSRDITQRKHQEDLTKFQATILANIQESVITTDLQGRITFWNEGAEHIFGYSASEMLGKTPALLYPMQDTYALQIDLQQVLAGTDYLGEWQGRRKDGSLIWIDIRTTLLRSTESQPIGFLGFAKDVTQRKQAEALMQRQAETLHQSQIRARRLIDANIIGVVISDMDHIFEANDAFLEIVGYTREDLAARRINWIAMTPPELLPLDMNAIQELKERGIFTPFEKAYYRKDGRLVPILIGGAVLEQDPLQWVCFILDISEQKQLEQALRLSEERLLIALKSAAISVYQQDRDLRYTWLYNPMQPHAVKDIVGKTDSDLLATEEAAYVTALKRRVMETGQSHQEVVKATRSVGTDYFDLSIEPLRDENGEIIGVTGTSRNTTEQVELEQRKDNFISIASHELRTPITVLRGFTQLLARQLHQKGIQDPNSMLQKMDAQISKLVKLIDELLDASKIQAGRLDYDVKSIDLDELVHETVEMLQANTFSHVLHVTGATNATIQGDRDRLGQVLINLITNAVKYSPEANSVDITLSSTQDAALISIRDFGVGIANAHLKHIFDRFYRVHDSSNKSFKGLGLGLYIAHDIVNRHGGDLTVMSKEGKGSTFTISLPIEKQVTA